MPKIVCCAGDEIKSVAGQQQENSEGKQVAKWATARGLRGETGSKMGNSKRAQRGNR